jgi:cell shape-determining protein MreC
LITDLNSKVSVILQDTGVNAILTGAGKKTNLILEYLPEDFEPAPNKIIYTSGKDGFLAAGLPIAETYLNDKNELKIKSLADPQQASIVHVVRRQLNK